jgi:hypothetical protein
LKKNCPISLLWRRVKKKGQKNLPNFTLSSQAGPTQNFSLKFRVGPACDESVKLGKFFCDESVKLGKFFCDESVKLGKFFCPFFGFAQFHYFVAELKKTPSKKKVANFRAPNIFF